MSHPEADGEELPESYLSKLLGFNLRSGNGSSSIASSSQPTRREQLPERPRRNLQRASGRMHRTKVPASAPTIAFYRHQSSRPEMAFSSVPNSVIQGGGPQYGSFPLQDVTVEEENTPYLTVAGAESGLLDNQRRKEDLELTNNSLVSFFGTLHPPEVCRRRADEVLNFISKGMRQNNSISIATSHGSSSQGPKAWVDDRNWLKQKDRKYPRTMTSHQLYHVLRAKRLYNPDPGMTDVHRRLIFISDCDGQMLHALVQTAPRSQSHTLAELILNHFTSNPKASIITKLSHEGLRLHFSFPYFAIAPSDAGSYQQDRNRESSNDKDSLSQAGASDSKKQVPPSFVQVVTSFSVTALGDRYWTGICLKDEFHEEEPRLEAEEDLEEAVGSVDPIVFRESSLPTANPRAYFLMAMDSNLSSIIEHQHEIIDSLDIIIPQTLIPNNLWLIENQRWLALLSGTLTRLIHTLSSVTGCIAEFIFNEAGIDLAGIPKHNGWNTSARDFVSIRAFRSIRNHHQKLQYFTERLDGCLKICNTVPGVVADDTRENDKSTIASYLMGWTKMSNTRSTTRWFGAYGKTKDSRSLRSNTSTAPRVIRSILSRILWDNYLMSCYLSRSRRLKRPKLKAGHRRTRWTCDCGVELFADFSDEPNGTLDQLAFSLQSSGPLRNPDNPDSHHLSTLHPSNPSSELSRSGINSQGRTTPGGLESVADNPDEHRRPSFLGLCVNVGGIYKALAEIETSSMHSDAEAFSKMKEEYIKTRGLWARFHLLVKPITVEFVEFSLWNRRRAFISVSDRPSCIPPEDSVKYDYSPKPLKPVIPMLPEIFIHYLNHEDGDLGPFRNDWLPRLPKRLDEKVIDSRELDIGWGLHIIEGPNREAIFWIAILTIGASVLTCVLWSTINHDVQGGAGLGALIVALPPAILTAFLFRLEGI